MSIIRTILSCSFAAACIASAQVTTPGFLNQPRAEAPGTLLSHPVTNGSEPIGRTTSINYLNGWVIVGAEVPGSRPGSDLQMRVYDISNPAAPVRRFPSDFGLNYPGNSWVQDNYGWNAHGTAQWGNLLLPDPIRVSTFGGPVQRGGPGQTPDVPLLSEIPLWYDRTSQAGPWNATLLWYDDPDSDIEVSKVFLNAGGFAQRRVLATFDHVGAFGGGDWHPMFFGDLLIMARSGGDASDGVVVYRLAYHNMEDADPANDAVTPQFVGSLAGEFQGYWPNLFSDGTGLYVIGSTTDILIGADITQAANPTGDGSVTLAASLTVPFFSNATYPAYQDNFGFIHNRKVDMTRFLAGDPNPIVLTLNEVATGVNTSQMSLPLGNLWLTGGYPIPGFFQGLGVWVHQQAPDTTRPRVSFHIPQAGRVNYPRSAPLSFLVHENPRTGGPRNGIDFAVRAVGPGEVLGAFVPGMLLHDFSGNMTFTPDAPLAADSTYQVDFFSDAGAGIGFTDAAGNFIEPYSYRFSTGGGINAVAPPAFTSLSADVYQPAPGGLVNITAVATGTGPLEFRFNFDGAWSAWGASASASHTYAAAGRPRVLVQVRDAAGSIATSSLNLLVIAPLPPGPRPTQSGTMAIGDDPLGRRLWSVNPDANTVTVLDAATGVKVAEHAVGANPRNIARDANGRYWVTCQGSDEIRVLNADGTLFQNIAVPYGAAPFGIAASPDGTLLYATMHGSAQLRRYSAANPAAAPLVQNTNFPTPRAIAVSADGARVLVTRFISPDLEAEVGTFNGATLASTGIIRLAAAYSTDGGDRASGVPNYLSAVAISPDGTRAAVASKQDNTGRGVGFGVGDLTHETTTRAVVSFIDLVANAEIRHTRRDFDNSDSPSALAYTPRGDTLLVALQGNNRLAGIDATGLAPVTGDNTANTTYTSPAVLSLQTATGLAPQGVLVDATSNRIFSQDFMGRSVTVRDGQPFLVENRTTFPLVATTATVATELLSAPVLLGKRIFYNAADPRMSADSYISCATCHVDGGHDGRVWDFTGRGEGLRRTTDLRGRSGTGHGNVHWSGNFDEIQDFEHDIRGPFGGTGFLNVTPQQFATLHPSPATGKTGLSADLDALAAYVASLAPSHTPRSPHRNTNGTFTTAALNGQAIFAAQNCASCHSGNAHTNSPLGPVPTHPLFNVGTHSGLSGARLGGLLAGIDVPTLDGLHAARTFTHSGLAPTLEEFFPYAGGQLFYGANAERLTTVNPNAVAVFSDNPFFGGGGTVRNLYGGTAVFIDDEAGAAAPPGIRFSNLDGGAGGAARIAIRYLRQYNGGTALLRVNGVQTQFTAFQQYPNTGFHSSGWLWANVDTTLQPGATNTIEILRGDGDLFVNVVLVANATTLAAAQPHRVVQSLSAGNRADLLAYLRQLDGRDASGVPFPPPTPPAPTAPSIVVPPASQLLAVGNPLALHVAVSGTGPFTFQWRRNGTPIGTNYAEYQLGSIGLSDAGSYTVEVSNAQGSIVSPAATVTVNPALEITTTALPVTTVGRAYSAALAATGGTSTRTWSIASGILPPGIALAANGMLSGTPTAPARAVVTFRVADVSGSDTHTLQLDVRPVGGFVDDPDLILHYTFDEAAGTQVWDAAPSGNNHATTVANAHWIADGRFGGAYGPANSATALNRFFPANQADLNFHPRGDAYTISVWVRTTFAAGGYRTVLGKGEPVISGNAQIRLWTTNTMSTLQGVNGNQGGPQTVTAPALNNGQWHLLTMVNFLDGATWRTRVFYDGAQVGQFNSGAGGLSTGQLRIGDTSLGGNGWNGQLDDLRIYRRALTQPEIAALYTAPDVQTFAAWVAANLTPAQQADPAVNGPLGDANGNGISNAIEFAIGTSSVSPLALELLGGNAAQLTLTRNALARAHTLIVETSTDLQMWTPLATSINGTPFEGAASISETTGNLRTVTLTTTAASNTFFRLRVSLP